VATLGDIGSVVPRAIHAVPTFAEHTKSGGSQATKCKGAKETASAVAASAIIARDICSASSREVRPVVNSSVALVAMREYKPQSYQCEHPKGIYYKQRLG
jgi:hypothetical protein